MSELGSDKFSDLKHENARLKREIEILRREKEILEKRMEIDKFEADNFTADLKHENDRLRREKEFFQKRLKRLSLPWEITHLIFQRAIAPRSLMMPDRFSASAWSLNLLTIQRLITVCRDWYSVGIGFLYAEIAVYRISQLYALQWTLQNKPDLAAKVCSLQFSCYIPTDGADKFEQSSLTPGIQSHRACIIPPNFAKSPLTSLCIHDDSLDFFLTTGSISLFANQLVSLIIYPQYPTQFSTVTANRPLQFPQLKSFQCHMDSQQMGSITAHWVFPVLTSFARMNYGVPSEHLPNVLSSLTFLRKHKRTITTVLIHRFPYSSSGYASELQEVLSELPHLRHLIIPSIGDLSVPQIHHLDLIQSSCFEPDDNGPPPIEDQLNRFPNLTSYRSVDSNLIHIPWIYTDLLPPCPDSQEYYQFRFPGIDIRGNNHFLLGTSSSERNLDGDSEDLDFSDVSSGSEDSDPPSSGIEDSEEDYELSGSEKEFWMDLELGF
ncbi:hypothetical protein BT96DRAFT_985658 [Gymnopus androsaceus JB14]|uniref:Uncharacterized protein n=1 Tax=Gymnopus androsaceus JB14 TaxID=1447944 RepID=A0A6A4IE83_9AGAR|nr:hypothetical protein BT96DRAFT_985658 [Gymnopus androsaceus JB14]